MSVRLFGRDAFFLAAVFFSFTASAHDGGHGKMVAGLGPHGGALAAVVSAKDADLGEKAKAIALAEWKRDGLKLEVHLLDLQKKVHGAKLVGDVKWILLKGEGVKPEVLVSSGLSHEFVSLDGVKSVEVILPAGLLATDKSVAAFTLK